MKIYIVTQRYGTEMVEPEIFKTMEEAENYAEEIIYDAAMNDYDGESDHPTWEELQNWAEENGLNLDEHYYWNGSYDTSEVMVTEHEI